MEGAVLNAIIEAMANHKALKPPARCCKTLNRDSKPISAH